MSNAKSAPTVPATVPARVRAPRRSHAERSAATREHLLAATLDVVRTRTVAGASMFEVAKAAGVTPGALQHHFGTKAELMLQVVERLLLEQDGAAVPWPSATLPLPRRARAYVDALWSTLYEPERFLAAWALYFGSVDDDAVRARIVARRRTVSATMHRRFRATFPEAGEAPGVDAFVDLLLSALRGLGVVRLFGPVPRDVERQLQALASTIELHCAAVPAPVRPRRPRSPSRGSR